MAIVCVVIEAKVERQKEKDGQAEASFGNNESVKKPKERILPSTVRLVVVVSPLFVGMKQVQGQVETLPRNAGDLSRKSRHRHVARGSLLTHHLKRCRATSFSPFFHQHLHHLTEAKT